MDEGKRLGRRVGIRIRTDCEPARCLEEAEEVSV